MEATYNMTVNRVAANTNDPLRVMSMQQAQTASTKRLDNRRTIGEFVGSVFYSTLLRQMQSSTLKSSLFHGGRGEDAFSGQLALELGKRIGQAETNPLSGRLISSMARQLEKTRGDQPVNTNLKIREDVKP